MFECAMAEWRRTARDNEVKRGRLVIEQTGQQDSAVKETRVWRTGVDDGQRGGGQQREPAGDKTPSSVCDIIGETVLSRLLPVGLPVGHLTVSTVDHSVVAAKQRRFSPPPAHLCSTLKHRLHTTWQHHPAPGHAHDRLHGDRWHAGCNRQADALY